MSGRRRKVMAVSSGGGHWVQLRRIAPAFEGLDLVYVGVDRATPADLGGASYHAVRDATRRDRLAFAVLTAQLVRIVLTERPEVVVTTGAAPGLIALALAKVLLRSRTIWIDSIANVGRMSGSGMQARRFADHWLTQWEGIARPEGPHFWGQVL
jgi:UDP-N-acetylglucosamine:LPS N-acetylglucosamine transferase